ncbi:phage baseplate protein [Salmonella enterica subsp. enterica]|nr:phage baseplate protein [Salmonella enterica subsp. enterica serovar Nigeria]EEL9954370.1 phage baseplate protein [Salmonella enterica subsp. enterica serovar Aba]EHE8919464.1 phage baseplate protein [Salmonella enterica subsp. enterica serovar Colorado]EBG0434594.1 phage baseplate protein [Salmonella enterica subsp. enterica serovar Nigeria]EBG2914472.1 phage baseplate protein [Salmonella enterica subsp. enterica serovar Nigeria]
MRAVSQVSSMLAQETGAMLFALEAKIISVEGGRGTVKPTVKRWFDDNDEPTEYPEVDDVRLLSLVWNEGKTGVTGQIKAGDPCLLIALSHGDGDAPDHKSLSNCVALCGFSDESIKPFPGGDALTLFHDQAYVTLRDGEIEVADGEGDVINMKKDVITATVISNASAVLTTGSVLLTAPAGAFITANTTIIGNLQIIGNLSWTGTASGVPGESGLGGSLSVRQAWINGIEHSTHEHPDYDGKTGKPVQG